MWYSLLYFAVSLCCQFVWLPPTLGIIGIMFAWVFSFNFTEKWERLKKNYLLIFLLLLFALFILGMLQTENTAKGWKVVTVKISMILLPLVLGTSDLLEQKDKVKLLLKTFAYCTLAASVFLLLRAGWLYLQNGITDYFFYHNLVVFEMVPVHYFAMYSSFTFFILLDDLLISWNKRSPSFRFFSVLGLAILLGMQFLYSVRIQLLAFLAISSVFLMWQLHKRLGLSGALISLISFLLLFSAVVYTIPGSRKRIIETFEEWQYFRGIDNGKQTNHRVYLWKYGFEVIGENFWTGTGTGDADDILYEKTKHSEAKFWVTHHQYYTLAAKKYNYHNAFLQHFAALGFAGFTLLLLIFLLPAIYLIKNFQFIPFCFLLLTFISFLTESMLERQAGNLFFAFMYGLIFVSGYYKKEVKSAISSGQ